MGGRLHAGLFFAIVLLCSLGGALPAWAQRTTLIQTDQFWRYAQPTAAIFDYSGWATPGYSDTPWLRGRASFAWETTSSTLAFLQQNAPTNTLLEPPEGRTEYFRTHFTWNGDTAGAVLTLSILVDDGAVIYLNGVEQERLRVPDGVPDLWSTFTTETTPGGDVAAWEVLTLGASNLVAGDNLLAVSVHQHNAASSDVVFGLKLTGISPFAPVVTDASQPSNAVVAQARSQELRVAVDAYPPPTFQWFFQPESGGGFSTIADATNDVYWIAAMDAGQAGAYYCRVVNSAGTVQSRTSTVAFQGDTTPPSIVSVIRLPNLTNVIVTFSEPMGPSALNPSSYLVCPDEQIQNCLTTLPTDPGGEWLLFVAGSGNTQVLLATDPPADPLQPYILAATQVADLAGNVVPDILLTNLRPLKAATFCPGVDAYAGTVDTYLRQDQPDTTFATLPQVLVDNDRPMTHGLLRFDNLIGQGAGQVSFGAVVYRATLSLRTLNATSTNGLILFHRMLQPWTERATWNAPWFGGLKADDGIAASAVDAAISPATVNETVAIDVTPSLQAWIDGALNYGWFLTNTVDDGWQFASSEAATPDLRPSLTVTFEEGPLVPARIPVPPPTNRIVVLQNQPFEIPCGVAGPLLELQWFKDAVALPGATNAVLRRAAATPEDAGTYQLHVSNPYPSATNSPPVDVQVIADTLAPSLTSAVAGGVTNLTVLTLTFSEPLAPASAVQATNYSLQPPAAIFGAALTAPDTVRLSIQAPFGQRYSILVGSGVTDVPGNPTGAPGNHREVATGVTLVDWAGPWKYQASNTDLLAANYQAPGYNDAAWPSGPGPLANEKAGGLDPGTILAATNYTSYYRRPLVWPFPAGSLDPGVEVQVRHLVDDGVVFHINGTEAFRFKMPPGTVTHGTWADNTDASDEAVLATNWVPLARFNLGTNSLAADLHPVSAASSDNVFGAEVLAVLPLLTPVRIVAVPPTNRIVVTAGAPFAIEFTVAGFQPQLQWFKDGLAIPGAMTNRYSVARALAADAGNYLLQATNTYPSATNSPVIQVVVNPDPVAPQLLSAVRLPEQTNLLVTFSKGVIAAGATNLANYSLRQTGNPAVSIPVVNVSWTRSNTVVTVQTASAVPAGYTLAVLNVTDLAGNSLNPNSRPVATPAPFQDGFAGYTGTIDTHLSQSQSNEMFGSATRIVVDGQNPVSHGLLRFDNLIGNGGLPAGATIASATLRLFVDNAGDDVRLHRMLVPWDESSTWLALGNGVLPNDVIAAAAPEATLFPTNLGQYITVDVTASVRAWATGAANFGWALLDTGTDGFQFPSSESGNALLRPALLVEWSDSGQCVPLAITVPPASTQTVDERQPVSFAVTVFGTAPAYQWQKNGTALPGATNRVLSLPRAALSDAGTYRCVVTNGCPSAVTTPPATLTVIPDTLPPSLVRAVARTHVTSPTLTNLLLTFDEPVDQAGAQIPGNFSVALRDGGSVGVTAAVLTNAASVRLALAAPLIFGEAYRVTVSSNLTDTAAARNPLLGTSTNVIQEIVLVDYGAPWRFDPTRTAASNYDAAVPAWYAPAFNDSAWAAGPGIFALETDPETLAIFPAPVQTVLTVATQTLYFRTTFPWPLGAFPSSAGLVAHHVVDDGLVCWLNGGESFRYKMATGTVTHATVAASGGEAELASTNLPTTALGPTNLLACSVHPTSPTSSDAVLGLELLAVSIVAPQLNVVRSGPSELRFSWTPAFGSLYQAGSPLGPWFLMTNANPVVVPIGAGVRFYSVRP